MSGLLLRAGDTAPDFSVTTTAGNDVSLKGLNGRLVFLALFRYAACPFCNLRVHRLVEARGRLEDAGIETIAVFPSSLDMVDKYIHRYRPPFHVVADPTAAVHSLYHTKNSLLGLVWMGIKFVTTARAMAFAPNSPLGRDGAMGMMPAEFLIGPDQVIRRPHYGRTFDDHLEIEEVIGWARKEGA